MLPLLPKGLRYLKRAVWLAGGGHAGGSGTSSPGAPHAPLACWGGLHGGPPWLLRACGWWEIGSPRHRLRCRHGADGNAAGSNCLPSRPTAARAAHSIAGPQAVAAQRDARVGLNGHLEAGQADPAAIAEEGEHLNRPSLWRASRLCQQERPEGGGCRAVPDNSGSDSMHGRGLGAANRRVGLACLAGPHRRVSAADALSISHSAAPQPT